MGQLNCRKTVIVRNSRFYHDYSVFEFFRAIFLGMSFLQNGGVPEPIFVHSLTHNGDKNDLLCHSLQIRPKLRSFPHSLSGAHKLQIWTVHVYGEIMYIKYDQTTMITSYGHENNSMGLKKRNN